jgi:hypothetical protein
MSKHESVLQHRVSDEVCLYQVPAQLNLNQDNQTPSSQGIDPYSDDLTCRA